LWWPREQGDQPLYESRVEILDRAGAACDTRIQRVGFRRVRLVLPDDASLEPPGFPKTRRVVPTTFEVNGRRIFVKGSNWVSPEIFPGLVTADTYRPLVQLACDAHFNLLRAWGGAPVPKEAFFNFCDESGLLVWQEFPLACNPYPDDAGYLQVLDQESRSIIRRVRRHPCLALWSGGNELFNSWSGMDDQALPLRLLNRNCYDLDPATPFIPTSPLEGTGHGDYRFRNENGRDLFSLFEAQTLTAYPEFGCPGPAPVERLRAFIPATELWPPQPGGSWSMHHGFGAWEMEPTGWLALATQQHYFGEPANLEELVARGDWLQSEGLKCLFEEARRQQPRCGMALNWCFNEPWPAAANNSLVHWPAHAKPALAAARAACRSALASARIPQFSWCAGEVFAAELWLLNDLPEPRPAVTVLPTLRLGRQSLRLPEWRAPGGANARGPRIEYALPEVDGVGELTLELHVDGHPALDSHYRLHYRRSTGPSA
jgi:beta-mannosidase